MGCGCGKKAVRPSTGSARIVARPTGAGVTVAQTYQSATIKAAPTGPVGTGRKTV